ncbi:hypothetical protein ACHAXT_002741 [Thalassiosira profunda]
MSYQQRPRFQPPELYSISRGIVSRIEPYGCFVKLNNSPISGLVHISQLHANKIADVNDVVSLEDEVWVKVMDVQVEETEDGRRRHKIRLSMKYAHQDTGQDLDPENEQMEADMQRGSKGGGGGGGGGNAFDSGASSQLGRSLASNIGMSTAIDPGNLVLKGKGGGAAATTSFNGYALVGEDEGEPQIEKPVVEAKPAPAPVARPMGRGRGINLPAWMTKSDPEDRLGSMGAPNAKEMKKDGESEDDDGSRHRSRKRDKRHRKERHRKHSRSSRKHRKKHKDRKRKDRRDRSESYSSYSDASASVSRSRSRSRSSERRSKSHRKKSKHRSRRRERSRSRSRSRSRDSGSNGKSADFTNVDEARAIMEKLERRRRDG